MLNTRLKNSRIYLRNVIKLIYNKEYQYFKKIKERFLPFKERLYGYPLVINLKI